MSSTGNSPSVDTTATPGKRVRQATGGDGTPPATPTSRPPPRHAVKHHDGDSASPVQSPSRPAANANPATGDAKLSPNSLSNLARQQPDASAPTASDAGNDKTNAQSVSVRNPLQPAFGGEGESTGNQRNQADRPAAAQTEDQDQGQGQQGQGQQQSQRGAVPSGPPPRTPAAGSHRAIGRTPHPEVKRSLRKTPGRIKRERSALSSSEEPETPSTAPPAHHKFKSGGEQGNLGTLVSAVSSGAPVESLAEHVVPTGAGRGRGGGGGGGGQAPPSATKAPPGSARRGRGRPRKSAGAPGSAVKSESTRSVTSDRSSTGSTRDSGSNKDDFSSPPRQEKQKDAGQAEDENEAGDGAQGTQGHQAHMMKTESNPQSPAVIATASPPPYQIISQAAAQVHAHLEATRGGKPPTPPRPVGANNSGSSSLLFPGGNADTAYRNRSPSRDRSPSQSRSDLPGLDDDDGGDDGDESNDVLGGKGDGPNDGENADMAGDEVPGVPSDSQQRDLDASLVETMSSIKLMPSNDADAAATTGLLADPDTGSSLMCSVEIPQASIASLQSPAMEGEPPHRALPTFIVTSTKCLDHKTQNQEKDLRLKALINREPQELGVLRMPDFETCCWIEECSPAALGDLVRVHDYGYLAGLREQCEAIAKKNLPPDAPPTKLTHPVTAGAMALLEGGRPDLDTDISPGSYTAAIHAAGAVITGVDLVLGRATRDVPSLHRSASLAAGGICGNAGLGADTDRPRSARNVFCAVRPPGHHAGTGGLVHAASQGFCLINNVAVGAAYAMSAYRSTIKRVAIVDFDVHHGDGTERIVRRLAEETCTASVLGSKITRKERKPWVGEADARNVLFCSAHLFLAADFYPSTGSADAAAAPGAHRVVNVPFDKTSKAKDFSPMFRRCFSSRVVQAVREFQPDLVMISAGFDAHTNDKQGNADLAHMTDEDYAWATGELVAVAEDVCAGRVVSVLEGGYELSRPGKMSTRDRGGDRHPLAKKEIKDHGTLAQSVAAHVKAMMTMTMQKK